MTNKDRTGIFSVGATYVSCLMIGIWLLDFFDLFGRDRDPQALSQFACAALPLAKIASPLIAQNLVNFSVKECLDPPVHEPAISIIFFMGKISLTFMAAAYYSLLQVLTGLPEFRQRLSFYEAQGGGAIDVLKYKTKGLVAFAMIYLAILIPFKTLPAQFSTNIPRKGSEDLSSLVLFICLVLFADSVFACVSYLKSRSNA